MNLISFIMVGMLVGIRVLTEIIILWSLSAMALMAQVFNEVIKTPVEGNALQKAGDLLYRALLIVMAGILFTLMTTINLAVKVAIKPLFDIAIPLITKGFMLSLLILINLPFYVNDAVVGMKAYLLGKYQRVPPEEKLASETNPNSSQKTMERILGADHQGLNTTQQAPGVYSDPVYRNTPVLVPEEWPSVNNID